MAGSVPGIPLPGTHPAPHHPGYTPPLPAVQCREHGVVQRVQYGRGLKSVAQLTLVDQISRFRGMTEVYNLTRIGRINKHYYIPGND